MIRRGATIATLLAVVLAGTWPAYGGTGCLTDEELRAVIRSVYTRSIGKVLRVCADRYRALDERAIAAAEGFLTTYMDELRANRLASNRVMARVFGEGWQAEFDALLERAIAGDTARAQAASEADCADEIARIEEMVDTRDYAAMMSAERPAATFARERARMPRCETAR